MKGVVNISEFTNYLKDNNLIIVSKSDYEQKIDYDYIKLQKLQQLLLKKNYLTIAEILKAQLFNVKTHQSVKNWINNGFIKADYVLKNKKGQIVIVAAEIKRIRQLKNLEL